MFNILRKNIKLNIFLLRCYCSKNKNDLTIRQILNKISSKVEMAKILDENNIVGVANKKIDYNYPNRIDIRVVSNGGHGLGKILALNTSDCFYFFGCGEGLNRNASVFGQKMKKCKSIFLTYDNWENISGLLNTCLTIESFDKKQFEIVGPDSIKNLFVISKFFGLTKDIKLNFKSNETLIEESCLIIEPIILDEKNFQSNYKQENYVNHNVKKMKIENRQVFNYYIKIKDRPAALDLEKCIELKVPIGADLGKLKSGLDVKLKDGRIIKHKDVCKQPLPGEEILIVSCPNKDYLNKLINNTRLIELGRRGKLLYVFHYVDEQILKDKNYIKWLEENFSNKKTHHIVLNEKCSNFAHLDSYKQKYIFNKVDSEMFDCLKIIDQTKECVLSEKLNIQYAKTSEIYNLFYQDKCNNLISQNSNNNEVKLNLDLFNNEFTKELNENFKVCSAIKEYHEKIKKIQKGENYPEVIFLGTGSAIPGKLRSCSCIFVEWKQDCCFILDCAEGSYYQLLMQFGLEECKKKLINLKFIFVSHYHSDHHLGLVKLLLERKKIFQQEGLKFEPLEIFLPDSVANYLEGIDNNFETISDLYNFNQIARNSFNCEQVSEKLCEKLGLENLKFVRVIHCKQSNGIIIQFKNNQNSIYKMVYSGDCTPSSNLVKEGMNCDLLIHEATFEDKLEYDAFMKKHSTLSQAKKVRDEMRSKFLICTHYSQRYAKTHKIDDDVFDDRMGQVFDNMKIKVSELDRMIIFNDFIKVYYENELEFMQKRTNNVNIIDNNE